jgi:hypothetical protein
MSKATDRPLRRPSRDSEVLLAVGDSVVWGQGLVPKDKFCQTIADKLQNVTRGLSLQNRAHSGASVLCGNGLENPITKPDYSSPTSGEDWATGEIPRSKPTILEQVESYDEDTNRVRYIIVDGGINDVGIVNIIDPLYTKKNLERTIQQHCYRDMRLLLKYISSKFPDPKCKIRLVGYYPILSYKSHLRDIIELLLVLGVRAVQQSRWMSDPIDQALFFWRQSDELLKKTVDEAGDPRIVFVPSGFSEDSALFTGDRSLLREPCFDGPNVYPVDDPVYVDREKVCEKYPQDSTGQVICPMASVGHPKETGAATYSDAIWKTL